MAAQNASSTSTERIEFLKRSDYGWPYDWLSTERTGHLLESDPDTYSASERIAQKLGNEHGFVGFSKERLSNMPAGTRIVLTCIHYNNSFKPTTRHLFCYKD